MISELDRVVLTHDIDEHDLSEGDVGAVVHCYPDGAAFEVEFITKDGETAAVLSLTTGDIRLMNQIENTIHVLDSQMNDLDQIVARAKDDNNFEAAEERLERWKARTVRIISDQINASEGQKLEERRENVSYVGNPLATLYNEADVYRGFLEALIEDLKEHPDSLLSAPTDVVKSMDKTRPGQSLHSKVVFIVHGHDELNLLKLDRLLKDRWHLDSVILKFEAGVGRTLIEKFEQEANRAGFAIVLITPDDLVETPDGTYTQSRPNVVFELGWFYGRIGREHVCLLCKRGTQIHTDLDGINRVDFDDSVDEATIQLEAELKATGIL